MKTTIRNLFINKNDTTLSISSPTLMLKLTDKEAILTIMRMKKKIANNF